jgi:NADPH:quinone reductase-like Zn-dependent oxidoreductase
MKALELTETGGPEVMHLREIPTPIPQESEVLIRVAVAELLDRAAEVFQAVVSGTLKLRMERTYSLGEAAQAHRDLESRKTTGKLLLLPSTCCSEQFCA